ncbi:MAG TPA: hypothetical protein VGB56_02845 [Flavisolibacter sp.]|jgi:hypothetical protein
MKQRITILMLLLVAVILQAPAQRTDNPWQLDISAGLHSFYAPVKDLKWSRPELVTQVAWAKPLGAKQVFSVGLQFGLSRNNYQGDALYLQLVGQYTPVIGDKLELGIGTGIGYRFSLYPSRSLKWDGARWTNGSTAKRLLQVPLQFTAGYRSLAINKYLLRPYAGVQLQGLFGYSPDLSFLPVTNLLMGVKIQKP